MILPPNLRRPPCDDAPPPPFQRLAEPPPLPRREPPPLPCVRRTTAPPPLPIPPDEPPPYFSPDLSPCDRFGALFVFSDYPRQPYREAVADVLAQVRAAGFDNIGAASVWKLYRDLDKIKDDIDQR